MCELSLTNKKLHYQVVQKVHVTHMQLNPRIITIAFTECTNLQRQLRFASGHAKFVCLQKRNRNKGHTDSSQQSVLFHHGSQNSCLP